LGGAAVGNPALVGGVVGKGLVVIPGAGKGDEVGKDGMEEVTVGFALGGSAVGNRFLGVGVPNGPQATITRKRITIIDPIKFLVFINSLRVDRGVSPTPPPV